jgi:hypothetical protein
LWNFRCNGNVEFLEDLSAEYAVGTFPKLLNQFTCASVFVLCGPVICINQDVSVYKFCGHEVRRESKSPYLEFQD